MSLQSTAIANHRQASTPILQQPHSIYLAFRDSKLNGRSLVGVGHSERAAVANAFRAVLGRWEDDPCASFGALLERVGVTLVVEPVTGTLEELFGTLGRHGLTVETSRAVLGSVLDLVFGCLEPAQGPPAIAALAVV